MRIFQTEQHPETYKACRSIVGSDRWDRLIRNKNTSNDLESLVKSLIQSGEQGIPTFLPDLARLESAVEDIRRTDDHIQNDGKEIRVNPSLRLLDFPWKNLLPFL